MAMSFKYAKILYQTEIHSMAMSFKYAKILYQTEIEQSNYDLIK